MYTPDYLNAIQPDISEILSATERAAETIENSKEYNNNLHPFHAAAVSTYNRLVSVMVELQGFQQPIETIQYVFDD